MTTRLPPHVVAALDVLRAYVREGDDECADLYARFRRDDVTTAEYRRLGRLLAAQETRASALTAAFLRATKAPTVARANLDTQRLLRGRR